MKIDLDLPDDVVQDLFKKSAERALSLDAYATERVYQLLTQHELGDTGKVENRPDWQASLERSRADLAAGRIASHEEVEEWHRSRLESSGREKR